MTDNEYSAVRTADSVEEVITPDTDTAGADANAQRGLFTRLYTGTGAFEVIGRRKMWFAISGLIMVAAVAAILMKGFTLGIDFEGGTKMSFPRAGATGEADVAQVERTFRDAVGVEPESVVVVGNGPTATIQIRSETLTNDQANQARDALFEAFEPIGIDGEPSRQAISDSAVSETWGDQITTKALIALAVFLVLVTIYITIRYERYMAMAALAALGFDLITTAGIYSLIGFEVTPATVIGLLTILGFSLYDTVIVFDKVEENTKGFEHTTRRTFAEQANLAINQTFMRSINTSVISVLPVVALMVVAVWILGVGTLKDLALVQLIGILVGTFSSIFFATPLLVSLRERTKLVRDHTRRVLRRRGRASGATESESEAEAELDGPAAAASSGTGETAADATVAAGVVTAPAPAARPLRPRRPTGKRGPRGK
jgi:preprotein translocase subunit SecF